MSKKLKIAIVGYLFIIIGILAILNSNLENNYSQIFWFCYAALILIGVGILAKDSSLLIMQLNILSIPLLIWIIDFSYVLIINQSLFGITDYFFLEGSALSKIISLQHLFTLPLTLYVLSLLKINRRNLWIYSFLEMAAIFIISYFFTSMEENANCVFESCISFIKTTEFYPLTWFGIVFLMIIITNTIIANLPFLQRRNKPISTRIN